MGLAAITAYPFDIGVFFHGPLVYTAKPTVVKECFYRRERNGMSVPKGRQLVRVAIHCPPTVAHDPSSPMPNLCVSNTLPIMLTFCWCWLCFRRLCLLRLCGRWYSFLCGRFRWHSLGGSRLRGGAGSVGLGIVGSGLLGSIGSVA